MAYRLRTNRILFRTLSYLLVIAIALMNLAVRMPITPRGIQCPTASIQQVKVVETVKDCCGRVVVKTTIRAPQEGETGFKQCHCAEKKTASHEEEKQAAESFRPITVALAAEAFAPSWPDSIGWWYNCPDYVSDDRVPPAYAPPTPPPQFI